MLPGAMRGSAGGGEGDVNGQATAGRSLGSDGGAVGGGDGADDGQADAMAVAVVCAPCVEPLEGLEQPVDLAGRDYRPSAGNRQDSAAVAGSGGDLDGPARDVVADGVVDQVGD